MIILSKKVFCFVNQEPNTTRANSAKFSTKGGMAMEEAPDWIKNDPLFQWAKNDGDVIVVENSTAKSEAVAEAAAEAAVEAAVEPKAASTKAEGKGKK